MAYYRQLAVLWFIAYIGVSIFHLSTCAPSSFNENKDNEGDYKVSLKDLADLLEVLEHHVKDKYDQNKPNATEQDAQRSHQVIFTAKGPESYASDHPELSIPIKEDISPIPSDEKRKIKETTKLWDNGTVPYSFSESSPPSTTNQDKIRKMMVKIEESTCITFEYVQPDSEVYHLQILDGSGCHSQIGNVQSNTGYQDVSLDNDGCMDSGTILHELLHALGVEHEQSRPDRDKYISINWDNVQGGRHNQNMKKKDNLLLFNIPFDQNSVMLYSPNSMAKHKNSKTYDSADPFLESLSEEAHQDLSFYDKLLLNRAYDCAGHCKPSNCTHGEFLNKDCTCTCPDGLTGQFCESVIQEGNCDSDDHIVLGSIGETFTLQSSGFPDDSYPTGSKCRWLIEGPDGSKLRVTILDLDILSAGGSEDPYCIHSLELRYNLIGQPGPEFCGKINGKTKRDVQEFSFQAADYSEANTMLVTFDTTDPTPSDGHAGFRLNFEAIEGNNDTKPVDFCEDVVCKNGGTCNYNDNNYWCLCTSGFRGRHCEHRSDQNVQDNQNTVFHCDKTDTSECQQFDLGTAWRKDDDGRFVVKQSQQGPIDLKIPYVIIHPSEQYCLHFNISRPKSPVQHTCSDLKFILRKEVDVYGIQIIFDDQPLFDNNCDAVNDVRVSVGFTSQYKILEMKFQVDNIPTEDANVALSDIRLDKAVCS